MTAGAPGSPAAGAARTGAVPSRPGGRPDHASAGRRRPFPVGPGPLPAVDGDGDGDGSEAVRRTAGTAAPSW